MEDWSKETLGIFNRIYEAMFEVIQGRYAKEIFGEISEGTSR